MIRMTLADYAKIHGQAKAASDFGVTPECSTLRLNRQLALRSMLTAFFSLQPLTASITGVSR